MPLFYREETEGPEDEVIWPRSHRGSVLNTLNLHKSISTLSQRSLLSLISTNRGGSEARESGGHVHGNDFSHLLTESLEDGQQDEHD